MSADPPPTDEGDERARIGFAELVERIAVESADRPRYVFGLAGPPGSGKSTVAARLAAALGGVVVPMDGFHLDNAELERQGLSEVKGAPETFDAAGFVRLVHRLRLADGPVLAPSFDRLADRSVDAAITVTPSAHIVIVEGNYLLHPDPPWAHVPELLDETWYVELADDQTRIERLIARHVEFGKSTSESIRWVHDSDQRNADLIAASRSRADRILTEHRDGEVSVGRP